MKQSNAQAFLCSLGVLPAGSVLMLTSIFTYSPDFALPCWEYKQLELQVGLTLRISILGDDPSPDLIFCVLVLCRMIQNGWRYRCAVSIWCNYFCLCVSIELIYSINMMSRFMSSFIRNLNKILSKILFYSIINKILFFLTPFKYCFNSCFIYLFYQPFICKRRTPRIFEDGANACFLIFSYSWNWQ